MADNGNLARAGRWSSRWERLEIPAEVDLRMLVRGGAYSVARYDETLITIWRGAPTVTAVDIIRDACETILGATNDRATYISVLERSSPAPGEAERAVLARWSREIVPRFASAIVVTEGGGFRSALIRAVVLALTAILPHRIPFRFIGSVEEGADLLGPLLRPGHDVTQLLRAIELSRAGCDGC